MRSKIKIGCIRGQYPSFLRNEVNNIVCIIIITVKLKTLSLKIRLGFGFLDEVIINKCHPSWILIQKWIYLTETNIFIDEETKIFESRRR